MRRVSNRVLLAAGVLALALLAYFFHFRKSRKGLTEEALRHQRAGEIDLGAGNLSGARREFEAALRLYREEGQKGNNYADSLQRLAQVYAASGGQKKAADLLAQAADECSSSLPMWSWIVIHRAELLDGLGHKAAAARVLGEARRQCFSSPDCGDLEKIILRVGLTEHLIATGNPRQARVELSGIEATLAAKRPEFSQVSECSDATTAFSMALDLRESLADWSTARKAGREALALSECDPHSPHALEILLKMGTAEAVCGDTAKAKSYWRKALSIYGKVGDDGGAKHARYLLNNIGEYASPWTTCAPE
ncbi:MAG: hypothetical protein KGL04_01550 [Elusimicrobia bacterium]|nr:hypothetical protein [Elusimicrobiota bacterium]MDE2312844.1 hypothetical protein [Elusimicrobiota bacterium]